MHKIAEQLFRFYRTALNAGRSSQEKAVCLSVRLSVCPSVKRVICDKTEE